MSRANAAASDNTCLGQTSTVTSGDIELGVWDSFAKTFTATTNHPNAVRVAAKRAAARGNAVPTVFGPTIGVATCDLSTSARSPT